jgi:hypothetical protein
MGEVSGAEPGWSGHPEGIDERVEEPEVAGSAQGAQLVGLGAICEIQIPGPPDGRTQSFSVSEYARLDDGRRVVLHRERGFTIGSNAGAVRDFESAASITQTVLNVVLPDDDDTTDAHPWTWLAELAQIQGLDVTAADLRDLPYDVVLTETVTSWLADR